MQSEGEISKLKLMMLNGGIDPAILFKVYFLSKLKSTMIFLYNRYYASLQSWHV